MVAEMHWHGRNGHAELLNLENTQFILELLIEIYIAFENRRAVERKFFRP